jgi:hypothetical protein
MTTYRFFWTMTLAVVLLFIFITPWISQPASAEQTCAWFGKAPFCNGECQPGWTLVQRDKRGGGDACVSGTKAKCCLTQAVIIRGSAPVCNGKCQVGEQMLGDSDYGPNGKKCVTGKAAICGVPVR